MNNTKRSANLIIIAGIVTLLVFGQVSFVKGTNEGSYTYGHSLTGPQNGPGENWNPMDGLGGCAISPSFTLDNGSVMPAVTNTTACINGFFDGWKNWCGNHALDCV